MGGIEKEFLEFCIHSGKNYGLDSVSSKLFGIVFLEPEAISMEDLVNRTGYSLASISNKMRFLQNFGLVERIKKPGSKKVFYYMEKDVIKLTLMHLEKIKSSEVIPAKEVLPKLIEKADMGKMSEMELKKLRIIKEYYKNMLIIDKHIQKLIDDLKEVK